MVRAITIDLVKILQQKGQELASDISKNVPVAEGKLRDSISSSVEQDGSIVRLTIEADEHFRFVELGRKPGGKMPPLVAVQKWCIAKGIPVKAAFPIAKSISKKGITPKHILKGVLEVSLSGIEQRIKKAFGESIKLETQNMVKRIFPS